MRGNGTYWFVGLMLAVAAALSVVVIMTSDDTCPAWQDGTVAERNEDGLCPKDPDGGPTPPLGYSLAPPPVGEADPFPPSEPDPVNPADQPGDPIDGIIAPGAEEPVVVDPDPSQPAEGDVDPDSLPVPPSDAEFGFTSDDPSDAWVKNPSCPDGSEPSTVFVRNDKSNGLEVSTYFDEEDGTTQSVSLRTDEGVIVHVFQVEFMPAEAGGSPGDARIPWAQYEWQVEWPRDYVWIWGGPGFDSGDRLQVCIAE